MKRFQSKFLTGNGQPYLDFRLHSKYASVFWSEGNYYYYPELRACLEAIGLFEIVNQFLHKQIDAYKSNKYLRSKWAWISGNDMVCSAGPLYFEDARDIWCFVSDVLNFACQFIDKEIKKGDQRNIVEIANVFAKRFKRKGLEIVRLAQAEEVAP